MGWGKAIKQAVADLVRRGRVTKVDDGSPLQKVNVDVRVGVIDTGVERYQNYGFSSVPNTADPLLGVEITCNGHRFVVALDSLQRPVGGEPGDVLVWHREGHFVRLTKDKVIGLECETMNMDFTQLNMNGNVTHNGNMTHNGDTTHTGNTDQTGNTTQTGTITASVDVVAAGVSVKNHPHYNIGNTALGSGKPYP
jgi:phage baseplate assembly protein V